MTAREKWRIVRPVGGGGSSKMSLTVQYLCISPAHQTVAAAGASADVSAFAGDWAYCPSGAFGEHQWQALGPVPLDSLRPSRRAPGVATAA